MPAETELRTRLSAALRDAVSARNRVAMAAFRSALAAIGNAEAVSSDEVPVARTGSEHFGGAATGLGAAEVPRRALSEPEVRDIVRAEIVEREVAARQYAERGRADRAGALHAEARVLEAVLTRTPAAD
jgi:uncharacterized protein YqeY